MSAATVAQALLDTLRPIEGLSNVMLGEPTSVQQTPALYVMYSAFDRVLRSNTPATNLTGMQHQFIARLIIQWVDNGQAEMQLLSMLDSIPDAIDDDPRLGGALNGGLARVESVSAGHIKIGDTLYRVADFAIQVLEKRVRT